MNISASDHLLSCDWGTSHFRLRLLNAASGTIVAEVRGTEGVGPIAAATALADRPDAFRQALGRRVEDLSQQVGDELGRLPVIISGMASSSIGWQELPYSSLPFDLNGNRLAWQELDPLMPGGGSVVLVSGVRDELDVMRGEETELLGLSRLPVRGVLQGRAVVILPGTHSKHVVVQAGEVTSFQTFMTGELFDLLRRHSSLRHSLESPEAPPPADPAAWEAAFCSGVRQAAELPLTSALFQVRARQLLTATTAAANTAYLSGLLVGAELNSIDSSPETDPGTMVVLCAGEAVARPYELGCHTLGLTDRLTILPPAEVSCLAAWGQLCLWERLRKEHNKYFPTLQQESKAS